MVDASRIVHRLACFESPIRAVFRRGFFVLVSGVPAPVDAALALLVTSEKLRQVTGVLLKLLGQPSHFKYPRVSGSAKSCLVAAIIRGLASTTPATAQPNLNPRTRCLSCSKRVIKSAFKPEAGRFRARSKSLKPTQVMPFNFSGIGGCAWDPAAACCGAGFWFNTTFTTGGRFWFWFCPAPPGSAGGSC